MRNDLVSVIIPAYNSEQYIAKCIESVINQTYQNIEIIVVNDGSSDNTASVVKQFSNVILLNKENGGLSSARNYGIKCAKGKYVIFLDSDDYIEPKFVENLYSETSGKEDEIIMCDFLTNGVKESQSHQYLRVKGNENIYNLYLHGGIYNRTVNKLYPIGIVKESFFPVGKDMLEDAFFTSHVLEYCNSIVRIPYAGYNYIRHENSMTKKKHNAKELASKYSNLLEKDIMLSKYVSKSEYVYLKQQIVNNIIYSFISVINIHLYEIEKKIRYLISFLYNNNNYGFNKKIFSFSKCLYKAKSAKQLKIRFCFYVLLKGSLKLKSSYIKSFFRKIIKKY